MSFLLNGEEKDRGSIMKNILTHNENSINRLLLNLNWFIFFFLFLYLFIIREQASYYISYVELFVNTVFAIVLLVAAEIWYFRFYKKGKFLRGLKYYILTSAIIIFICAACISKDTYILSIFYYPLVASALYYNNRFITYIIAVDIVSICCLVAGNYIDSFYKISTIRFNIEIGFAVMVSIFILVRYSNTSRKVISAVKSQKNNLKISNDKLTEANEQLNDQHLSLTKLNGTLIRTNEELEAAYKELRKSQTQLIYHEKMASLGKLAAGVAHEMNTPAGVINCNVDNSDKLISALKTVLPGEEESRAKQIISKLDSINQINFMACRRIVDIVKSLRNFTRLDEADYQEANIHEGIDNTLVLLKNKLKVNIKVIKDYGKIPMIRCIANQLNQVFLNLIVNAADAISGNGTIWIKTYLEKDKIFISIRDSGTGIPVEYINRIFEFGFSTKEVGKGTGLGLAIVYNIIEKHNGILELKSKEGEGTEFIIQLPLKQDCIEQTG